MPFMDTTEKRFEDDITASLWSEGGYTRNDDVYDPKLGLFPDTQVGFVQRTQPLRPWRGSKGRTQQILCPSRALSVFDI